MGHLSTGRGCRATQATHSWAHAPHVGSRAPEPPRHPQADAGKRWVHPHTPTHPRAHLHGTGVHACGCSVLGTPSLTLGPPLTLSSFTPEGPGKSRLVGSPQWAPGVGGLAGGISCLLLPLHFQVLLLHHVVRALSPGGSKDRQTSSPHPQTCVWLCLWVPQPLGSVSSERGDPDTKLLLNPQRLRQCQGPGHK